MKNKIIQLFGTDILAIMPEKIEYVMAIRQKNYSDTEITAAKNRRATKYKNISGNIAILPLYGYISQKPTFWSDLGLETSSEEFALTLENLANDSNYGAIVIDVDSPGGDAMGLTSASEKIFSLRNKKPIIAVSNSLNASAAYFLSSAAGELIADADSQTGCIGTLAIHAEGSKMYEDAGIKVTVFRSDKFKGEGNQYEPLTPEAKEYFQKQVNEYSDMFVSAVARNREKSILQVKQKFGQGRVLSANEAKEVGMVDRVASLSAVLADNNQKKSGAQNKNFAALHKVAICQAAADREQIT
jgi:signal peptide peptidase SppA